jgi:SNF1-activating kinase 1
MKRKNSREDKMKLLRKSAIQASPHTPLTERLGTTENKIRKEIAIMKKCRHAHVVRLLEVIDDRMKYKIYMGEIATSPSSSPLFFVASPSHQLSRFG